jgi:predicted glycosyltransferase
MKILIDIGHPAHVHFFRNPIRLLQQEGHDVLVTSRDKDVAVRLLDEYCIEHTVLSRMGRTGIASLARELLSRNIALYGMVQRYRPKIMAEIGGTFVAHVGTLTGIPSLAFYDTENAKLQNAITYPFASRVIVPRCYRGWLPRRRHLRYAGYHELSYLHPRYFQPQRNRAIAGGLSPHGDTFLLRTVSWQANHDIGEGGWSTDLLRQVVGFLKERGKVLISAEGRLPDDMENCRYSGKASDIHHLMAFCRACVGESATMASESAMLGVPALYAAHTGRGYTDEQEQRYQLTFNVRTQQWKDVRTALEKILSLPSGVWKQRRAAMLRDTIDVAEFVAACISQYPAHPALGTVRLDAGALRQSV